MQPGSWLLAPSQAKAVAVAVDLLRRQRRGREHRAWTPGTGRHSGLCFASPPRAGLRVAFISLETQRFPTEDLSPGGA